MSEPESKIAPIGAERIFAAIIEGPQRRRWPVLAVIAGVAMTYLGFRLVSARMGTNVLTPFGVRTVHVGMTTKEVNKMLGRPIAIGDAEPGQDCFRYGYPNVEERSFVLYTLCYEQKLLRSISQNRYTAWALSADGSRLVLPGTDQSVPLIPGADEALHPGPSTEARGEAESRDPAPQAQAPSSSMAPTSAVAPNAATLPSAAPTTPPAASTATPP